MPAYSSNSPEGSAATIEGLVEAGQEWWERLVPEDIREEYEIPDIARVEAFLADLEIALETGSLESLAPYEPQARAALGLLRSTEVGGEMADWLEPRLDFLAAAGAAVAEAPPAGTEATPPPARARPTRPGESPTPATPSVRPAARTQPHRTVEYWQRTLARRPVPPNAGRLVPRLKEVFRAGGLPPELVWLAEVESSMNPKARSPAGALGLFQFMPATAERFGLRTSMPDERLDPVKSARAASDYLRFLHERFQSWPLALAAYNAGEGRVGRALATRKADSFESVAAHLPAETQLYVPKVLATISLREGVDPLLLPAPAVADRSPKPPENRFATQLSAPETVWRKAAFAKSIGSRARHPG